MQLSLSRADSVLSVSSSQPVETPRSGFSSFGTRVPSISSRDAALYGLAQGLVPVINDPSVQSHLNPAWCWPFGGNSDSFSTPPPLLHGIVYEVTLQDFRRYMRVMADKYSRFEANLASVSREQQPVSTVDHETGDLLHSQGDGLAQSMRQVPPQYFTEEFSLPRLETWQNVCPSESETDRQDTLDQLSSYLDVVETHLLRDIAARSENFFQAAGVVQDLRGVLARTYIQVKSLRKEIHLLDEEVLEAAVTVQKLQRRRGNLKALQQKLQVVEHVTQSQYALQLLLPQGDYAGALEIINDIQATLEREGVQQLQCFRHLPHQLTEASEAVQQLMASDLLSLLHFHGLSHLQDHILAGIMQHQEYLASGPPLERGQYRLQSEDGSVPALESASSRVSEAFSSVPADPLGDVVSLGRAAVQGMQPDAAESDELSQLVTPLVLGLKRTDGLSSVLKSYKEAMAAEVKQAIRDTVEQVLPVLLGQQWSNLQHHSLADKLQAVTSQGFLWLLAAVLCASEACLQQCKWVRGLLEEGLKGGRIPRTQWTPLLQGTQEAAQAVSEVSHGRWAKLLASRAKANNEMRLDEVKQMLQLCTDFSSMAEGFGCRPVTSVRTAVQLQCKSCLDNLHQHTLTNLTGALEQESWSAVPVPTDSQHLINDWVEHAAKVKPASSNPAKRPSALSNGNESPEAMAGSDEGSDRQGQQSDSPPASTSGRPPNPSRPFSSSHSKHEEDVLRISGQGYHVAHTVLLLSKMLQSYMTFQEAVPLLAAETARRAVELLKVFNSRMCQLVLGAGAMQVSGLRSITAKHLALSSQCLSACMALHPLLKPLLIATLPTPRLGLLLPEFDRLLQDLGMHKEEIHSKLVAIMRERLSTNLKQLPLVATTWTASPPAQGSPPPPSPFAQTNAKQLRILSQVLSPILLPADLHSIFGRVAALFSKSLAEAFSRLEPRGMGWEAQCGSDLRHLLQTLQHLPMDPSQAHSNIAPLIALCNTRFAALPSQPSSSMHAMTTDQRPRHLHRSLTENDARAQQHTNHVKPISPRSKQPQTEPHTASNDAQDRKVEGIDMHEAGDKDSRMGLQNGKSHAANSDPEAASHRSSEVADETVPSALQNAGAKGVTSWDASQQAQLRTGILERQQSDMRYHGAAGGQDSPPGSAAAAEPESAQVGDEVQQAAALLEEAADQDVQTADDGDFDMVATSSAMAESPVLPISPELPAKATGSDTRSEHTSNVADTPSEQPDELG